MKAATSVSSHSEAVNTQDWSNLDCPHLAFHKEHNKQLLCTLSCLLKQTSLICRKESLSDLQSSLSIISYCLWEKILSFAFMFSSSYYAPVMSFCVFNTAAFLLLMETKGCSSIINVNFYKKHCPLELSCFGLSN